MITRKHNGCFVSSSLQASGDTWPESSTEREPNRPFASPATTTSSLTTIGSARGEGAGCPKADALHPFGTARRRRRNLQRPAGPRVWRSRIAVPPARLRAGIGRPRVNGSKFSGFAARAWHLRSRVSVAVRHTNAQMCFALRANQGLRRRAAGLQALRTQESRPAPHVDIGSHGPVPAQRPGRTDRSALPGPMVSGV